MNYYLVSFVAESRDFHTSSSNSEGVCMHYSTSISCSAIIKADNKAQAVDKAKIHASQYFTHDNLLVHSFKCLEINYSHNIDKLKNVGILD